MNITSASDGLAICGWTDPGRRALETRQYTTETRPAKTNTEQTAVAATNARAVTRSRILMFLGRYGAGFTVARRRLLGSILNR